MMAQILEHHGPLAESVLASHEAKWGARLPDEYRRFLLEFNGGYPEPDVFRFKGSAKGSSVDRFLGIHGREANNLISYLATYKNRLPNELFPIAHDPGGNLICIALAGHDTGNIYFWDHEMEADEGEEPSHENVTLIADSFDKFIAGLEAWTPPTK